MRNFLQAPRNSLKCDARVICQTTWCKIYKRKSLLPGFTGSSPFEIHTWQAQGEQEQGGRWDDLPDMNLAATQGSSPLTEHLEGVLRPSTFYP